MEKQKPEKKITAIDIMKEYTGISSTKPQSFIMISIHEFAADKVNDKFILFAWEYSKDLPEASPTMPILRRRELEAARRFCADAGMIQVPRKEEDPAGTVEYWVQGNAPEIVKSW